MVEANPYIAPTSDLVNDTGEVGDAPVFSFKTRIGRLRYLARVSLFAVASYFVMSVLVVAVVGVGSDVTVTSILLMYGLFFIASVLFGVMFATQRLHDLNQAGGWSVLLFIPLVNIVLALYLLFASGTAGQNNYGAPPPPNTFGVKLAALSIFPVIIAIGIIAAIAIPAYEDYVARAQQAQMQVE